MKTAMKKKKKKNRSFSIATIAEMFFSLLMIPVGLAAAQALDGSLEKVVEMLAFLMLAEFVLLSLTNLLPGGTGTRSRSGEDWTSFFRECSWPVRWPFFSGRLCRSWRSPGAFSCFR